MTAIIMRDKGTREGPSVPSITKRPSVHALGLFRFSGKIIYIRTLVRNGKNRYNSRVQLNLGWAWFPFGYMLSKQVSFGNSREVKL